MMAATQAPMRLVDEHAAKRLPKRFGFTRARLDSLKAPEHGRLVVYDTAVPRLSYMLTANGAASFYLVYKLHGRMRRYRIGDGDLPIEQARKLTADPINKITKGIDPQDERQQARAEQSFGEVWKWFMEHHVKPRLRTADELQQKYDLHLAAWSGRRFNSITRNEVAHLHQKIGKTSPGSANRLVALLSSLYNRARDLGCTVNPAAGINRFPENKRERYLLPEELPRFHKGLKAISQDMRDLFELALYTGARFGNIKSMEWGEVDFTSGTWSIPADKFKTGKPVVVPLVKQAAEILERRKKACGNLPQAFVFPAGDSESGHIERPEKSWAVVCSKGELKDLRIHDLRHSLASWQAASGVSLSIIGRGLGHATNATTSRYAHVHLDPVRAAMGAAVNAMSKASKAKPQKKATA
jgi:integrase